MKQRSRYILLPILLFPFLMLLFATSFTSCDPHRRGSVVKGPSAPSRYHSRPASAKSPRRNKY